MIVQQFTHLESYGGFLGYHNIKSGRALSFGDLFDFLNGNSVIAEGVGESFLSHTQIARYCFQGDRLG